MLDQYMYDGKPLAAPASPYVDAPDPIDITQTPEYQAWRQRQDQIRQMLLRQQAPPQFTPERMDPRQALIGGAVAGLARLFGARNAGASLGQYLQGVQGQVNQRNQDAYNRQMQGYQRDQFSQNRDMQVANLDERTAAGVVDQIQRRNAALREAAIAKNKAMRDAVQQDFENKIAIRKQDEVEAAREQRLKPKWLQNYEALMSIQGTTPGMALEYALQEFRIGEQKIRLTQAMVNDIAEKTKLRPEQIRLEAEKLGYKVETDRANTALQERKFQADEIQRAKDNQFRQKDQEIRALDVNSKLSGTAYKTQIDAINLALSRLNDELKGHQKRLEDAYKAYSIEPDEQKSKVLSDQYRSLQIAVKKRSAEIAAKKQILLNKKAGLMSVGGTVLPPSIQPPQN